MGLQFCINQGEFTGFSKRIWEERKFLTDLEIFYERACEMRKGQRKNKLPKMGEIMRVR